MQKFIPIKPSSSHANSLCGLNTNINTTGSIKKHFEPWSDHLFDNKISYLLWQEQICLKMLWLGKAWQWEKHLLIKGSLSLNKLVHDLKNLLRNEHSFQKHKNIFRHLALHLQKFCTLRHCPQIIFFISSGNLAI